MAEVQATTKNNKVLGRILAIIAVLVLISGGYLFWLHLSKFESTDDARASFTLRVAESALDYTDDRFGPSHKLITSAYRDGIFAGDDQRLRLAHMWHGEVLSAVDRHEEALAIAIDGQAGAQRDRQGWAYQMFETWHGRMPRRRRPTATKLPIPKTSGASS